MRRLYVAGPMSGLQDNNYPAFNDMAAKLRAAGHHVENPAESEPPPCDTWEAWMRLALTKMLTCEAIVLLPGWTTSRGANVEVRLARDLGMRIYYPEEVGHLLRASATV